MEKLKQEFFTKSAEEVAKGLLGRYLVCKLPDKKEVKLRLTEIAAYEGTTKTSSKGISYAPGLISISTKFNQRLIDIATGNISKPSCITLRGAELELESKVEQIKGPGKLTSMLGIMKENIGYYDAESICGDKLWIEGNSVEQEKIKEVKGNSINCIGIYKI